ncbi:MAG: MogA/MoaB family molybdenum cofactor biosynthesis protein [Armatimonadota bacterium]
MIRVGVLTVSDRCFRGEQEDRSGPAVVSALPADQCVVTRRGVVPDEKDEIVRALREWLADCDLVITTGGTGLSPRDVTPEATMQVVDRLVPGIVEALRADGLRSTPFSMLSRGIAGVAQKTLVVNLPGSPKAVAEGMAVLLPVIQHAVSLIKGGQ